MDVFDPAGHRLYLAADERAAFLEAAKSAPREVRTLCQALRYLRENRSDAFNMLAAIFAPFDH